MFCIRIISLGAAKLYEYSSDSQDSIFLSFELTHRVLCDSITLCQLTGQKTMKNNKEDDFLDRKQSRRKNIQNKTQKKSQSEDEDYFVSKKNKHNIKEKKEDYANEEWEDWDRYYNH